MIFKGCVTALGDFAGHTRSRCPPDVEVDLATNADLLEILSAKHAEMTYFAILGIYTTSAIKITLTDIIALPNSCPR